MSLRIGVFFGGRTAEHEISIISAQQAIAVLKERYTVVPVYIAKDGAWYCGAGLDELKTFSDLAAVVRGATRVFPSLDPGRFELLGARKGLFGERLEHVAEIDVAFPVMHGVHGEDGALQGLFEMGNIPYAGSAVAASAAGMDKVTAKQLFGAAGLPVTACVWFYAARWHAERDALCTRIEGELGYPVVVKPADLGSSIGVAKADDRAAMEEAVELALEFSGKILVEPCVPAFREINCAALGDRERVETSVCEEPVGGEILSFSDKYQPGGGKSKGMASARRIIPAPITPEQETAVKRMAEEAFRALDCAGAARIDFLMDGNSGQLYVNEINTIPGSLSFYLWEAAGMSFPELLDAMIRIALNRHREKERLQFSQETSVLDGYVNGGAKGAAKGAKG